MHQLAPGNPTTSQLEAIEPTFDADINAMATATGNRPAVYLLEVDGIGSSSGIAKDGALPLWAQLLKYEVAVMSALPHTVVYLEAGYSDTNSPKYTAQVLNAAGVRGIRGFFTNDTHEQWTINEVRWANKVSRLTGNAHYVVNTAQNGRGPLLNPHPVKQGIEDLCKSAESRPRHRGYDRYRLSAGGRLSLDSASWQQQRNQLSWCYRRPPAGTFWWQRAVQLATNANGQLGPTYPSLPY